VQEISCERRPVGDPTRAQRQRGRSRSTGEVVQARKFFVRVGHQRRTALRTVLNPSDGGWRRRLLGWPLDGVLVIGKGQIVHRAVPDFTAMKNVASYTRCRRSATERFKKLPSANRESGLISARERGQQRGMLPNRYRTLLRPTSACRMVSPSFTVLDVRPDSRLCRWWTKKAIFVGPAEQGGRFPTFVQSIDREQRLRLVITTSHGRRRVFNITVPFKPARIFRANHRPRADFEAGQRCGPDISGQLTVGCSILGRKNGVTLADGPARGSP